MPQPYQAQYVWRLSIPCMAAADLKFLNLLIQFFTDGKEEEKEDS